MKKREKAETFMEFNRIFSLFIRSLLSGVLNVTYLTERAFQRAYKEKIKWQM
jgi:hypothetical protein